MKSTLDKAALIDCLENLASIPQVDPTILTFKDKREGIFEQFIKHYPSLFIFAYKGITAKKVVQYINEYYEQHPVSENRKPKGIIINKKFIIIRNDTNQAKTSTTGSIIPPGSFHINDLNTVKKMEGFPFAHLMNSFCGYVGWLATMRINAFRHFNTGFGFKDHYEPKEQK